MGSLKPWHIIVLAVLLVLPGGLADGWFKLRDGLARRLAVRHSIEAPSLIADRAAPVDAAVPDIEELVEEGVS